MVTLLLETFSMKPGNKLEKLTSLDYICRHNVQI